MALFGRTFDAAGKARIAAYEAQLQANAVELDIDLSSDSDTEDEVTEVFASGRFDSKGREICWVLGTRKVEGKFYAWVQNARKANGKVSEFGTFQRSKEFPSLEAAVAFTKRTAVERLNKLA
ncbi:hypothetical protein POR1_48 [Pseudomonas phage POR1]|uniref:Uncharacterized protein n=1 Tax=Pseudomonas phage POR1 TaxID=1718594 RepID=A0A0N9RR25_9CAUD|nr:hypothetical protein POR1_48 [Pseudomonas phage POR1]